VNPSELEMDIRTAGYLLSTGAIPDVKMPYLYFGGAELDNLSFCSLRNLNTWVAKVLDSSQTTVQLEKSISNFISSIIFVHDFVRVEDIQGNDLYPQQSQMGSVRVEYKIGSLYSALPKKGHTVEFWGGLDLS